MMCWGSCRRKVVVRPNVSVRKCLGAHSFFSSSSSFHGPVSLNLQNKWLVFASKNFKWLQFFSRLKESWWSSRVLASSSSSSSSWRNQSRADLTLAPEVKVTVSIRIFSETLITGFAARVKDQLCLFECEAERIGGSSCKLYLVKVCAVNYIARLGFFWQCRAFNILMAVAGI